MRWFSNLPMGGKFLLGFGAIVTLLAVVIAVAYSGISSIVEAERRMYESAFANAISLTDFRAKQYLARLGVSQMLLARDPAERDRAHQEVKALAMEINSIIDTLRQRNRDDPAVLARLEEFAAIREDFAATRDDEQIPLIYDGRTDAAIALTLDVQTQRDNRMQSIADTLAEQAERRAAAEFEQSVQTAEATIRAFAVIGLIALASAIAMAFFLTRIIATPLREFSSVAGKVADGDLTVSVPFDQQSDEVGMLARAFAKMIENLRQVTAEIREGSNVLASSASEIVATTTQVASGSAETATAVSETASTAEEVKQTAQLAAEKARQVADAAQQAAEVSESGRRAVEQSVETINRVREQMEAITESIVRLAEHGQAIGEITATVNDLAEQTNLLAVNASMEAAKAGEQGRGFAVVAQEMKSLAEQSKQATTQVRAILGDVQKGTATTVMAAEQGDKAVEAGVKQVAEAGEAIRALSHSVTEAARAAAQIAASSHQQQVGMDQVAQAIENIRQASAQNVAGTKQAETAAHNLHDLGQRLRQTVEQYRV